MIENQENNLDTVNEEYKFLQDDLKRELSKLDGLEETMKKLNEILEFSEKSSMKFRFDQEQNDLGKYSELNHDNMGTTQSNHRNKNNFNSKSSNEKMNVNNYNNLNNLNTNESKTSNSKKVMDSRKETQKQNKVQVMQSSFPNHNTNESKASKKIDNENDYQANLSYVPISNKQNENLNLPNMNSVPSNNSNIEAPVINKEPDEINEISCIPNYNTNDTKLSKKNVPIDRNIINLDNGEKSLINQAQKNFDSHSNARYDNVDETSLNDLDYMKDLLMKTKNDLDKVATKFNTNSNLSSQMNFDDDEMEPRKLPNFLSNKFH